MRERGFVELGAIVGEHSIHFPPERRHTVESNILYYADKRFIGNMPVSVTERYRDFTMRYRGGVQSPENARWEQETMTTERLLFPDGPPF